jgi:transcriptional regulator with XRE-family HTH domain
MDGRQLVGALRAIRIRQRLRQEDIETRAGVPRHVIGRVERGLLDRATLADVNAIAFALDARLNFSLFWHGGDLGRLINARHAAMHESMARLFARLPGWIAEPEVSFSYFGERGLIDLLAWHPARRVLLVVELKTELVEVQQLMGKMDQRSRLASKIAQERGWDPIVIASWVVLADSRTNRRRVKEHQTVLRAKFPSDGRTLRRWLRLPVGPVCALSFLPNGPQGSSGQRFATVRRVRRRRTAPKPPPANVDSPGVGLIPLGSG